ncbi:uncharacterized protein [Epargyreus clarus]|uniref:uncharacterized protein isoform X2 n=1 Tax=Epargyreus clarus TaxID=520877 RepID=UPI003C3088B7
MKMTDVIDLSDDDDCILECVVEANIPNKSHSDLYYEVYKINQQLADFIEKCLSLEDTIIMAITLKNNLLKEYYQLEQSVKDSPKIQKAIRRANNLLDAEPKLKYNHINDLCKIMKASKVKKKVPFITLATNLTAPSCKKPKLDIINLDSSSPVTETAISVNFDDTTDTLDESIAADNCTQESTTTEEDNFLVPHTSVSVDPPTTNEERIKKLERRLAYYKKQIAKLDELEVDDDTMDSPYIKSERLKSAIVVIYNELCQLMGSQPVKRKEIRLRVVTGHPPGPTRILETFLNNNIGSDGQPPFPDFCDVVNCVVEANEKDDLGWTKCQIMKEAAMLFTQCGRALQKRRQNREYQDLLWKVKEEHCQDDPADNDPELLARLEENKRIAIKKESEILERYTMMESLPTKPKVQKNGTIIKKAEPTTTQEVHNNNNNSLIETKHDGDDKFKNREDITSKDINDHANRNKDDHNISDDSKKSVDDASHGEVNDQKATQDECNDKNEINKEVITNDNANRNKDDHNISDDSKKSVDDASHGEVDNQKATQDECNDKNEGNKEVINSVAKESCDNHNIEKTAPGVEDNVNKESEKLPTTATDIVHNKADCDNKILSNGGNEITNTELSDTVVQNDNHGNDKSLDASNNETCDSSVHVNNVNLTENVSNDFIATAIKKEPEEELSSLLENMGHDFTLVIEDFEHPTITIEISDSSDDELDQ